MNIPNELKEIIEFLEENGAKALIVGGAVRDYIMGQSVKDWDIEVYNILTLNSLEALLEPFGSVNKVGKSYAVVKLKVNKYEFDFSLPRIDTKVDKGHKGFSIKVAPNLELKEAFKRRDFTINAIGYHLKGNKFLDPFNGMNDIKKKILRVIDIDSFQEDPLRVYRGIQFSARFNFTPDTNTLTVFKNMTKNNSLDQLPKERIFIELKKLLLKSKTPSIGFKLMYDIGIIDRYFNELNNPKSWQKMLKSLDAMAAILQKSSFNEDIKLILMFATICYNLSQEESKKLLTKVTWQKSIIDSVLVLIKYYLTPFIYFENRVNSAEIKKLSTKVNINRLLYLARAYYLGDFSSSNNCDACDWLQKRATQLNVLNSPPKAIVQGKDLIELGLKPSKEFKNILDNLYNRQLNGEFLTKDEAKNIIRSQYAL